MQKVEKKYADAVVVVKAVRCNVKVSPINRDLHDLTLHLCLRGRSCI